MLKYYIAVLLATILSFSCGKMVATPDVIIEEISPELIVIGDTATSVSVTVKVKNDVDARAMKAEFSFRKNDGSSITGVNNITRYIDVVISGKTGKTVLNSYPVPTVEIRNYLVANPTEQVYLNIRISGEDAYGYEKQWSCEGRVSASLNR
ncbi:hypothetical protein JW890_03155 [candidate division WOR-3 bacterium]|nr:hypothetical protein [candidate division WOR-3 bacterium]